MKKFNVVRAKKYVSNKEEKTVWLPVGTITEFDNGNQILELNDRQGVYQIFPFKERGIKDEQQKEVEDDFLKNIPF